ncbi:MAG: Lipoprotein signal peptidase, partial [uncultured bacterium]
MRLSKGKQVTLIVILLLIIDQAVKLWIKTNMTLGESIPVFGSWFQIYFIENNGMAFGMQLGGAFGKFLLSSLRIVLIGFIIYYIVKLLKLDSPRGVLTGMALILV